MMRFTETNAQEAPVEAIYADPSDRFLVSLVVSYGDVSTPEEAIGEVWGLLTDDGSADTLWCVYDRTTGRRHLIEQVDALSEWPSGGARVMDEGKASS